MQVSTYDICVQGFERLRSQTEVLLTVPVSNMDTAATILEGLRDEIKSLDCDYDHASLRNALHDWWHQDGESVTRKVRALDDTPEGEEWNPDASCYLFVYIAE